MYLKSLICCVISWCSTIQGKSVDSDIDITKYVAERIIGGMEFEEGKWPFLVSLQGRIPDVSIFGIPLSYRTYSCGASLISERWIITAAHCFPTDKHGNDALAVGNWHAKLGDIDYSNSIFDKIKGVIGNVFDIDDWKNWYLHAEKIIIHPHYDPNSLWHNDIALVKLDEVVPSGEEILPHIQSVDLPTQGDFNFPVDNQRCVMKGWGCTQNGGAVSSVAKEVILPKVSDRECKRYWGINAVNRMCAGHNLADKGICSGDSGGPLTCQSSNGRWIQVGIASFTSQDRPGSVPGVFTRVSQYVNWIKANTGI